MVSYTIELGTVVCCTMFASSLHTYWGIFDAKFSMGLIGEKERMNKKGTDKPENAIVSYTIQLVIVVYHTKFEASSLHSSSETFDEKFNMHLYGEKERMDK